MYTNYDFYCICILYSFVYVLSVIVAIANKYTSLLAKLRLDVSTAHFISMYMRMKLVQLAHL